MVEKEKTHHKIYFMLIEVREINNSKRITFRTFFHYFSLQNQNGFSIITKRKETDKIKVLSERNE